MKVRPLRDRILVKPLEQQEQRIGGIIIPDTAKEKPQTAKVVAVGKGRVNDKGDVFPLDVQVGDYVLVGKYAGTEIKPALPRFRSACYATGSIMDTTTPLNADSQPDGPEFPSEPAPPIESRFLFVDVAALRAKQLRRGARVRIDDVEHLPKKAERMAMEEVKRGLVYYDVPEKSRASAAAGAGE